MRRFSARWSQLQRMAQQRFGSSSRVLRSQTAQFISVQTRTSGNIQIRDAFPQKRNPLCFLSKQDETRSFEWLKWIMIHHFEDAANLGLLGARESFAVPVLCLGLACASWRWRGWKLRKLFQPVFSWFQPQKIGPRGIFAAQAGRGIISQSFGQPLHQMVTWQFVSRTQKIHEYSKKIRLPFQPMFHHLFIVFFPMFFWSQLRSQRHHHQQRWHLEDLECSDATDITEYMECDEPWLTHKWLTTDPKFDFCLNEIGINMDKLGMLQNLQTDWDVNEMTSSNAWSCIHGTMAWDPTVADWSLGQDRSLRLDLGDRPWTTTAVILHRLAVTRVDCDDWGSDFAGAEASLFSLFCNRRKHLCHSQRAP